MHQVAQNLRYTAFLAVQVAEVDRLAVDRLELEARRRRSDEAPAGGDRLALRARVGGLRGRVCRQAAAH
jgi:hypothetical protein